MVTLPSPGETEAGSAGTQPVNASREQMRAVTRILQQSDYSLDFTTTCLTIEALVGAPEASLPLLSSSIDWLIKNQYREEGGRERGAWGRNTSRITLSLLKSCQRLQRENERR